MTDSYDADEEIPIERWEQFHAAVERLPAEQREVFKLIWYLGLDQRGAADALGLSVRTLARRWAEAWQMVRSGIERCDAD